MSPDIIRDEINRMPSGHNGATGARWQANVSFASCEGYVPMGVHLRILRGGHHFTVAWLQDSGARSSRAGLARGGERFARKAG